MIRKYKNAFLRFYRIYTEMALPESSASANSAIPAYEIADDTEQRTVSCVLRRWLLYHGFGRMSIPFLKFVKKIKTGVWFFGKRLAILRGSYYNISVAVRCDA